MPKLCEHLLNLKQEKIANFIAKCPLICTGNKTHHEAPLDLCLSCGESRCLEFGELKCSHLHAYGSKHPLVYRMLTSSVYCFTCDQNLTEAAQQKEEMENSNNKLWKIIDIHAKIIELADKLHEKLKEKALNPEPQKKIEKQKTSKIVSQKKQEEGENQIKTETQKLYLEMPKQKTHLEVFGLKNLGNTCFFNSTLQCLYATEALHLFYDSMQINTQVQFGKVGEIVLLFRKFLKNTEKHLNPKAIFSWVCRSKGVYKHMDQQDAQELLGVLLNGLIDGQKFWMGEEKVKSIQKGKKCTISERIFGFYLASRLECLDCEKVSWSIDFSLEVAVSLSKTFQKKIALPEGQVPKAEINEEGLIYPEFKESGCIIDTFFMPEYLGKDNYFTCEGCKSQKAVRKFYLKDPPLVLILTLKRFNNNLSKNNAEVKIVQNLELEGHCLNPGRHYYQLYSMIVHSGTARGGHYTACCRRGEGWVYFSDDTFKTIPWEKVRSSQPYILFYRRMQ